MGERVQNAATLAAGLAGIMLGRTALFVVVLVIGLLVAGSVLRHARASGAHPAAPTALAAVVALFLTGHLLGERAPTAFPAVVAAALLCAFFAMTFRRERQHVTVAMIHTLLPVIVVGLLGAYVLALRGIDDGMRLILALVLMSVAADAGAAAMERRGSHGATEAWHRPAAGIAATLAAAVLVALTLSPPFTWVRALVLALLVGPITLAGDAVARLLEHDAGERASRMVMFRRLDGVLLSAPVFFYAFRVLAR